MLILDLQHPAPDALLIIGQTFSVAGRVTDQNTDTPFIEAVMVALDDQPPVRAHQTRLHDLPVVTALFQIDLPVPSTLGAHSLVVTASDDGTATDTQERRIYSTNDTPHLLRMVLTLHTHGDGRDPDTVLHVFVRNRSATSATPLGQTSFIGNLTAWLAHALPVWCQGRMVGSFGVASVTSRDGDMVAFGFLRSGRARHGVR